MEVAEANVYVQSDGSALWVPPVNYLYRCPYNEDTDTVSCSMRSVPVES